VAGPGEATPRGVVAVGELRAVGVEPGLAVAGAVVVGLLVAVAVSPGVRVGTAVGLLVVVVVGAAAVVIAAGLGVAGKGVSKAMAVAVFRTNVAVGVAP